MKQMRRAEREISKEEALALLESCEYAVLALADPQTLQPYCVPVSPVLIGEHLYFHCATAGEKWELLQNNPRVCLNCVGNTKQLPEQFSTLYESATAWGEACAVSDPEEKKRALYALCEKYAASNRVNFEHYIAAGLHATGVVRIEIAGISGKANRGKSRQ